MSRTVKHRRRLSKRILSRIAATFPAAEPSCNNARTRLIYSSDSQPGLRRVRRGTGFQYVTSKGHPVTDLRILQRVHELAIPPAWKKVWICTSPNGHLQATGFDVRGRKQYRYHAAWRQQRDADKFGHLTAFGKALPRIRARVEKDLARHGLPKAKVLAALVRLLETTAIRVGNDEYARTNHSHGLTTLHNNHVQIGSTKVCFQFRGKGGFRHCIELSDRRLTGIIKRCRDIPGQMLFQYLDQNGRRRRILSTDVNQYLKEIAGVPISAKDFRTWAGTFQAVQALKRLRPFTAVRQAKRLLTQAVAQVARRLGNTPAICRKCYIHPLVVNAYLEKRLFPLPPVTASTVHMSADEAAVLAFLANVGS